MQKSPKQLKYVQWRETYLFVCANTADSTGTLLPPNRILMQYKPIIIHNSKYKTQHSSVVLCVKNFVNAEYISAQIFSTLFYTSLTYSETCITAFRRHWIFSVVSRNVEVYCFICLLLVFFFVSQLTSHSLFYLLYYYLLRDLISYFFNIDFITFDFILG